MVRITAKDGCWFGSAQPETYDRVSWRAGLGTSGPETAVFWKHLVRLGLEGRSLLLTIKYRKTGLQGTAG